MNTPAGIAAQVGSQETGGNRAAGMCHHRERYGPQQYEVIVAEAPRQVGRKRIADAGAMGRVSARTEADDLGEVVGSSARG
jgi:hypothetical protein